MNKQKLPTYSNKIINLQQKPQQRLDLAQVWRNLLSLKEVSDDSIVEQTPGFIASQSINPNSSTESQSPMPETYANYNQNGLQVICDSFQSSCLPSPQHFRQILTLKQTNQKLLSDNRALFAQCVKLMQIIQQKKHSEIEQKLQKPCSYSKMVELQIYCEKNEQQIEELKTINNILKKQLSQKSCKNNKSGDLNESFWSKKVLQLQKQKIVLINKISDLQRGRISDVETQSYKNCSSPSDSTQYSHKYQNDRERIISNMKIVYETQNKKLQHKIKEQNLQLEELRKLLKKQSEKTAYFP